MLMTSTYYDPTNDLCICMYPVAMRSLCPGAAIAPLRQVRGKIDATGLARRIFSSFYSPIWDGMSTDGSLLVVSDRMLCMVSPSSPAVNLV